jgi:hypothetical protein
MSSLTGHSDQLTRRLAAQRLLSAERSRRADAGTVTEMARSLLRDARDADTAEGRSRRGGVASPEHAARRELAGARLRVSSRSFAGLPA